MAENRGILIESVREGSPAARAGLRAGERVLALNGQAVRDSIDVFFHAAEEKLAIQILEAGEETPKERVVRVRKTYDEDLGLQLEEFAIRKCNNHCVFCFIHQNPKGLRKSLYFKDGDYRMSFLHGNYITTTNLTDDDLQRIVEQRLSPQYVSVHATNDELRARMLGVKSAPPILERLRHFTSNGVEVHAQIVLCPGWNDGAELERSARELAALGKNLLSIAVVPLGMTEHRAGLPDMRPSTPSWARKTLEIGERLQAEVKRRAKQPLLFFSDEFYLLAGRPWPDYRGLDVLHQLENGVGMLANFYNDFSEAARRLPRRIEPRRVAALTGWLGVKALKHAQERLNKIEGMTFDIVPLDNSLFGRTITVSGLLSGRDFLRGIREQGGYDTYLIPGNALRGEGAKDDGDSYVHDRYKISGASLEAPGHVFLDDMTVGALREKSGAHVEVVHGVAADMARAALGRRTAREAALT